MNLKRGNPPYLHDINELQPGIEVYIYGAGVIGILLAKKLANERPDVKVCNFIDDFKVGIIAGKNILTLSQFVQMNRSNYVIIIASAEGKAVEKIYRRLIETRAIDFFVVNSLMQGIWGEEVRFTGEEEHDWCGIFNKVKDMFIFDADKSVYEKLINARKSSTTIDRAHDIYDSICHSDALQYLEFIHKEKIEVIIEGGVFDGYYTEKFLDFLPQQGFLYGFEPNIKIFEMSSKLTDIEKTKKGKIIPRALWHEKGTLPFYFSDGASGVESSISSQICVSTQEPKGMVDAISVDAFVEENNLTRIDFLKLDVEGAEVSVLKGARKTIVLHRPQLAISIYHQKKHLYEIPLLLAGLCDKYVFRIGHYSPSYCETIFYAIPKEVF